MIEMFTIIERVMSFVSKPVEPRVCIYEERIKCFQKLAELQKNLKAADESVSSSQIEGDKNALERIESYTKEYKKEYEFCEKIMKY